MRSPPNVLKDGVHPSPGQMRLDRALRLLYPGVAWTPIRRAIETGKLSVDGRRVTDPGFQVGASSSIELRLSTPRQRDSEPMLPAAAWVFIDRHVVVIDKPPNLSSVPYEPDDPALSEMVRRELGRREGQPIPPLGIVHRLDKETSGLILFARNLNAKRALKQAFRFHTIVRCYVALCHGQMEARTIRSRLVPDRGDGRRGSTTNPKLGQPAVTHVRVLKSYARAMLCECRLETGRTHQIRIHLAEAGHPLVGERVYTRGFREPPLPAPRLMLHARELGFTHPASGEPMHFESEIPADMQRVLDELETK